LEKLQARSKSCSKVIRAGGDYVHLAGDNGDSLCRMEIIAYLTGGRFRPSVGPHTYEISEDGFIESNSDGRKEIRIAGIRRVAETGSYFFIFGNTGTGYVIPKKELANFDALRALQQKVSCKPKPA